MSHSLIAGLTADPIAASSAVLGGRRCRLRRFDGSDLTSGRSRHGPVEHGRSSPWRAPERRDRQWVRDAVPHFEVHAAEVTQRTVSAKAA